LQAYRQGCEGRYNATSHVKVLIQLLNMVPPYFDIETKRSLTGRVTQHWNNTKNFDAKIVEQKLENTKGKEWNKKAPRIWFQLLRETACD
jgi:hypothetical protein